MEDWDVRGRSGLTAWVLSGLQHRPEVLERLWNGSRGSADPLGWRWCEYQLQGDELFLPILEQLQGTKAGTLPTAPVFVMRTRCPHCQQDGFYATDAADPALRQLRGVPGGRCAACRRAALRAPRRSAPTRRRKR